MRLGVTVAYAREKFNEFPTIDDYRNFIKWCSLNNFEGFEIAAFTEEHFNAEFLNKREKLKDLVRFYKDLGLVCDAFEAGFLRHMLIESSEEALKTLIENVKRCIDIALDLEAELIYAHTAPHPTWKIKWERLYDEYTPPSYIAIPEDFSWENSWRLYVNRVKRIVELVENNDLLFALEIRPYEIISSSDLTCNLIREVDSKSFGLVFDTGHFFVQKEILPLAFEKLHENVFLIHLCDNDGCRDYHWAPGKGKIDWENFLRVVIKKFKYERFANIDVAGKYADIGKEIIDGKDFILKILKEIR